MPGPFLCSRGLSGQPARLACALPSRQSCMSFAVEANQKYRGGRESKEGKAGSAEGSANYVDGGNGRCVTTLQPPATCSELYRAIRKIRFSLYGTRVRCTIKMESTWMARHSSLQVAGGHTPWWRACFSKSPQEIVPGCADTMKMIDFVNAHREREACCGLKAGAHPPTFPATLKKCSQDLSGVFPRVRIVSCIS